MWNRGIFLHRHPKIKLWLPPGGHVEADEDPVEAVLREIKEETGLLAAVSETPNQKNFHFDYPKS
ncbi:MAG: NUDIX domain-containing protein, partial [Chloroflexota bacterium]|nr:NUDIX domain-containing protein [Chloroflexota bacterium]